MRVTDQAWLFFNSESKDHIDLVDKNMPYPFSVVCQIKQLSSSITQKTPSEPNIYMAMDKKSFEYQGYPFKIADLKESGPKYMEALETSYRRCLRGHKFPEYEATVTMVLDKDNSDVTIRDDTRERRVGYSPFTDDKGPLSIYGDNLLTAFLLDGQTRRQNKDDGTEVDTSIQDGAVGSGRMTMDNDCGNESDCSKASGDMGKVDEESRDVAFYNQIVRVTQNGIMQWDFVELSKWYLDALEFQKRLLFGIQAFGGPSRGAELVALLIRVSIEGGIAVGFHNGLVMIIQRYLKTRNLTGSDGMAIKSFGPGLGRYLIYLLTLVRPTEVALSNVYFGSDQKTTARTNYERFLFVDHGKLFSPEKVSKVIRTHSKMFFGWELGPVDLRQITKFLLTNVLEVRVPGEEDSIEDEEQAVHYIMGHRTRTANRHYAITSNSIASNEPEKIRLSEAVSLALQVFYGIESSAILPSNPKTASNSDYCAGDMKQLLAEFSKVCLLSFGR